MLVMAGQVAGCIGLLTVKEFHPNVVPYDDITRKLAVSLGLNCYNFTLAPKDDFLLCVHGRDIVKDIPEVAINIHPCLYKFKGKDPIGQLLASGERMASVGAHRMTSKIDEGEVLAEEFIDIGDSKTRTEVYNLLYPLYPIVILKALRRVGCSFRK